MRTIHLFLIDSDHSGHRLSVDGDGIGTFPTLAAAEAKAAQIAESFASAPRLRFELDFKWTLSDSEMRVARLECPNGQSRAASLPRRMEKPHVDR
jgi:hypothetical protein